MPNKIKHSPEDRCLAVYLYWFCRDKTGRGVRGFLSLSQIERITGVPGSSVSKISRGVF